MLQPTLIIFLTNHPDVYLYGALYFASTFIRGMDQTLLHNLKSQYEAAIKQVEDADDLDKYNGYTINTKIRY